MVAKYIDWAKENGVSQKAFDDLVKSIVETSELHKTMKQMKKKN